MSSIQAVGEPNVQYMVLPQQQQLKEERNFIEGVMWGVNGVSNVSAGAATIGGTLLLDGLAIGVASVTPPHVAFAGLVGLTALNVLAFYVAKAEISIASKSFTHMINTI